MDRAELAHLYGLTRQTGLGQTQPFDKVRHTHNKRYQLGKIRNTPCETTNGRHVGL
jgi:hypothetical protein